MRLRVGKVIENYGNVVLLVRSWHLHPPRRTDGHVTHYGKYVVLLVRSWHGSRKYVKYLSDRGIRHVAYGGCGLTEGKRSGRCSIWSLV
ncbi:MAG TPA: hypothetical protein EYP43_02820 [Thermoplasmata archaeon]|nr:hypothetical protein [Thermoplasmata archaeon]